MGQGALDPETLDAELEAVADAEWWLESLSQDIAAFANDVRAGRGDFPPDVLETVVEHCRWLWDDAGKPAYKGLFPWDMVASGKGVSFTRFADVVEAFRVVMVGHSEAHNARWRRDLERQLVPPDRPDDDIPF